MLFVCYSLFMFVLLYYSTSNSPLGTVKWIVEWLIDFTLIFFSSFLDICFGPWADPHWGLEAKTVSYLMSAARL